MMDADLRRYLTAVKAEEPPASSADPRWDETETLARRLIAETKAEAALKVIDEEPARRKRWDLLLLTGLLREGLEAVVPDEIETWVRAAERLKERQRAEGVPMGERRPRLLEALNELYEKVSS